MALMCRRKAFSVIPRYRLCGRFSFSSFSPASSSSAPSFPRPPSVSQIHASQQLWPAIAMAMHTSLAAPLSAVSVCTTTSVPSLGTHHYTTSARDCATAGGPLCLTHKCTGKWGCSCTKTGGLFLSARSCTSAAYPPPTPPGEFQGGDDEAEAEADGANLNLEESAGDGAIPPEGSDDLNMPPYDDLNYADEDGEFEDEDPPPDPEASLLYSPSDSD